jgi:hypothetical protein
VITQAGCDELTQPVSDTADDVIDDVDDQLPDDDLPPGGDEVAAAFEAAIFEKLECEDIARPSTLERVKDVLHDPTGDEIAALLLNPQDLATVVALGGAQVDGPVLLARNLLRVVDSGAGRDLLDGGWDGVSCGSPVAFACTAGEGATTVTCDGAVALSIALSFDGCTLDGTIYDGALTLDRVAGDDTVAALAFAGFTLDETDAIEGALLLDVGQGSDAFAASVSSPDILEVEEHGGLAAGLECSAETTFETAGLVVDATSGVVQMKASQAEPDATMGIETFGDHLAFGDPLACACPLPGSGVLVDVPRPLGREGETARARITWGASADACSAPHVLLEDWPPSCAGLEDVNGDCAKGATESTLTRLLGALCAP